MADSLVVSEWIMIAEDDLESAKILANYHRPKIEIACFLSQQCAEKALKAFLIFSGAKHKYIHDLKVLCVDCQAIDKSFTTLKKQCNELTDYYTDTRYGRARELFEHDMKKAIQYAEEVLVFVKDRIK
jgi:HEPN domain-containing protein